MREFEPLRASQTGNESHWVQQVLYASVLDICHFPIVVVPRTWVSGNPRGYGNMKTTLTWVACLSKTLGTVKAPPGGFHYSIQLDFKVCAAVGCYGSQYRVTGPDLDNLVKQTIDGLATTNNYGLKIISSDALIFQIVASKTLVEDESSAGVFISISACAR